MMAQASLHICADSPVPLLLAYMKYGCILTLGLKFRPYTLLDQSAIVQTRNSLRCSHKVWIKMKARTKIHTSYLAG